MVHKLILSALPVRPSRTAAGKMSKPAETALKRLLRTGFGRRPTRENDAAFKVVKCLGNSR
jgi:hypothetical protein